MANNTDNIDRLPRLLGWPRRLMRRKGHGIHSPFAYDFVGRVISQPCGYYVYERLLAESTSRHDLRMARLLFRTVLHFRPESVACDTALSEAILTAVKTAVPAVETGVDASQSMFIICGSDSKYTVAELAGCASRGGTIFFTGLTGGQSATMARTWNQIHHGMLLRGRSVAIMAGALHLPHQCYDVWI